MKRIGLVWVAVAVLACKSKEQPKPPPTEPAAEPTPTAKAVDPAPAAKPVAKLGAGETLATLEGGKNPLSWTAGKQPVEVAVINKDNKVWLRAYVADKQVDVTTPVEVGEDAIYLEPRNAGAAVFFRVRTVVDRVPEAGALMGYNDQLITWDDAGAKPVVSQKWDCDETKVKGGLCEGPAWTNEDGAAAGGAAAGGKLVPKYSNALEIKFPAPAWEALDAFTTALMNDDREAIIKMLAPDVDGCAPKPAKLADVQANIRDKGVKAAFDITTTTWPEWELMWNGNAGRIGIEPKGATGSNGYLLDKQKDGSWKLSRFCANNSMADPNLKPD